MSDLCINLPRLLFWNLYKTVQFYATETGLRTLFGRNLRIIIHISANVMGLRHVSRTSEYMTSEYMTSEYMILHDVRIHDHTWRQNIWSYMTSEYLILHDVRTHMNTYSVMTYVFRRDLDFLTLMIWSCILTSCKIRFWFLDSKKNQFLSKNSQFFCQQKPRFWSILAKKMSPILTKIFPTKNIDFWQPPACLVRGGFGWTIR